MLSHRDAWLHTQKHFHTHTRQTNYYTEMILHWATLRTDTITNRGAFTKEWIYTRSFYIRMFLHRHTFAWFPTAGPHLALQEFSKADVKPQFHRSFWWSRRISWERVGPAQAYIEISFQFFGDRAFRASGLCFVDYESTPPCRPKRKFGKLST